MKRISLALLSASLVALAAVPAGSAPAGTPLYAAQLTGCHRSVDPKARAVDADAGMYARVPGTSRMGIRFDLFERRRGQQRFHRVSHDFGGKLSVWLRSHPVHNPETFYERSIDISLEHRTVPAAYFFRVGFRWYSIHGRVLRERSVATAKCFQPDMRPDLKVARIDVKPSATPGRERYRVVVRNVGATATASSFAVTFEPGTVEPESTQRTSSNLGPGKSTAVVFDGPLCSAGSSVAARADSQSEVDERNEANNRLEKNCP
jgi:hypothetical protein